MIKTKLFNFLFIFKILYVLLFIFSLYFYQNKQIIPEKIKLFRNFRLKLMNFFNF